MMKPLVGDVWHYKEFPATKYTIKSDNGNGTYDLVSSSNTNHPNVLLATINSVLEFESRLEMENV